LTNGGGLYVSGTVGTFNLKSITSNLSIPTTAPYNVVLVDTSAARTITLPSAAAQGNGKHLWVYDVSGLCNTHNITFIPTGSDTLNGTNANFVVEQNFGAWEWQCDASGGWWLTAQQLDRVLSPVEFTQDVTVDTTLITGQITGSGGNLSIGGTLTVTNGINATFIAVNGDVTVTGEITTDNLDATGTVTLGPTEATSLIVDGSATVGTSLAVGGASVFTGQVDALATLEAHGPVHVQSTMGIDGVVTMTSSSNLTFNAGSSINGFITQGDLVIKGTAVVEFGSAASLNVDQTAIATFNLGSASSLALQSGAIIESVAGTIQADAESTVIINATTYEVAAFPTFVTPQTKFIASPCSAGSAVGANLYTFDCSSQIIAGGGAQHVSTNASTNWLNIPLRVHNGATLTGISVTFAVLVTHSNLPATLPAFLIWRSDGVQLKSTGAASPNPLNAAAWNFGGNTQSFAISLNQFNVIDTSQYTYALQIIDEYGTNSQVGNIFQQAVCSFTSITSTEWGD
jgi:hypothetical protein